VKFFGTVIVFVCLALTLLFAFEAHAQYGGGSFFGSGWAATVSPGWSPTPPNRTVNSVYKQRHAVRRSRRSAIASARR
jgi:hypothetical protein